MTTICSPLLNEKGEQIELFNGQFLATPGDFKAEAAGIGPGLLWTKQLGGQSVSFIAKWLHEVHAENRMEGDHVFLSFAFDW